MNTEPVTVLAATTGAITTTLAILLFAGVDPELVGAITASATAWVGLGAAIVRSKVTPTQKVALTVEQADELQGGPRAR